MPRQPNHGRIRCQPPQATIAIVSTMFLPLCCIYIAGFWLIAAIYHPSMITLICMPLGQTLLNFEQIKLVVIYLVPIRRYSCWFLG